MVLDVIILNNLKKYIILGHWTYRSPKRVDVMRQQIRLIVILITLIALAVPLTAHTAVVGRFTQVSGQVDLLKQGKIPAVAVKVQDGVEPATSSAPSPGPRPSSPWWMTLSSPWHRNPVWPWRTINTNRPGRSAGWCCAFSGA